MDAKLRNYIGDCLDRLVKRGYNEEDARRIISICVSLPSEPEKNDLKDSESIEEFLRGEQIGNYRVRRIGSRICFYSFWENGLIKNPISTPEIFHLHYDDYLCPTGFYVEEKKEPGTLGLLFGDLVTFILWLFTFGMINERLTFYPIYLRSLIPQKEGEVLFYKVALDFYEQNK